MICAKIQASVDIPVKPFFGLITKGWAGEDDFVATFRCQNQLLDRTVSRKSSTAATSCCKASAVEETDVSQTFTSLFARYRHLPLPEAIMVAARIDSYTLTRTEQCFHMKVITDTMCD